MVFQNEAAATPQIIAVSSPLTPKDHITQGSRVIRCPAAFTGGQLPSLYPSPRPSFAAAILAFSAFVSHLSGSS